MFDRITINPEIAHGNPSIRNKRYTVEGLLEYLAAGDSIEDLLKEFLTLKKKIFSPVYNALNTIFGKFNLKLYKSLSTKVLFQKKVS